MSAPAVEPPIVDAAALGARGFAVVPKLLRSDQCAEVRALCTESARYRKTVVMDRHGFGRGEYRYFGAPLPPIVQDLRSAWYERLVPIARSWREALARHEEAGALPDALAAFTASCAVAGQTLPTCLVLRYTAGDYNCLHQDLYGDVWFPLQLAVLLDEPGEDFDGGDFVLVEQRPRMQSHTSVVPLRRGDAVIFATHHAPRQGGRGPYRVAMRHGVSEVTRGVRHVLGVIFHDAKT